VPANAPPASRSTTRTPTRTTRRNPIPSFTSQFKTLLGSSSRSSVTLLWLPRSASSGAGSTRDAADAAPRLSEGRRGGGRDDERRRRSGEVRYRRFDRMNRILHGFLMRASWG
jgi:hypothetical protein